MKLLSYRLTAIVAIFTFIPTSSAQEMQPLSKQAASVQQRVSELKPAERISVIPVDGEEEFGTFRFADATSFTFHDVDEKIDVTMKFIEVRKVKHGYGGYNTVTQRHTDRRKATIVIVLTGAALVAIIAAAAAAK